MTQELLKLALEALKDLLDQTEPPPDKNCSCHIAPPCSDCVDYSGVRYAIEQANKTITTIKEALAQEQEPVAIVDANDDGYWADILPNISVKVGQMLYTHPPQRTWVGLEGQEIRNLWEEATKPDRSTMTMVTSFAKSIEAKLKQKNGYAEEKNT